MDTAQTARVETLTILFGDECKSKISHSTLLRKVNNPAQKNN